MNRNEAENDVDERPSKSQIKREMDALQEVGKALAELSLERLAKVPMSDRLREAVEEFHRVGKHEAQRRQLQYIGKLMRSEDVEPIQVALDALSGNSRAEVARQHRLERLRERLLEDDAVFGEIATEYPGADLQYLRSLKRSALKEREVNKPPRAFRELFKALRALQEDAAFGSEAEAGEGEGEEA